MRYRWFLLATAIVASGCVGVTNLSTEGRLVPHRPTVILTMDVSGSMAARDIKPTRIEAMQAGTKSFIANLPKNVSIGIVAFAGAAFLVQPPTVDHAVLDAAIDHLVLQPRTAIGSGILTALAALFPDEDFGLDPFDGGNVTALKSTPEKNPVLVEPASDKSAVIILMTDGASNAGPDPIQAAHTAANHGVCVYMVGFGPKGGNEESLKRIADITRARYRRAGSAEDLALQLEAIIRQAAP